MASTSNNNGGMNHTGGTAGTSQQQQQPLPHILRSISRGDSTSTTGATAVARLVHHGGHDRSISNAADPNNISSDSMTGSGSVVPVGVTHAVPLDEADHKIGISNNSAMPPPNNSKRMSSALSPAADFQNNNTTDGDDIVIDDDDDDDDDHSTSNNMNRAVSCVGNDDDDDDDDNDADLDDSGRVDNEDESDYEYDYEDDDDGHFQGFLEPAENSSILAPYLEAANSASSGLNVIENTDGTSTNPSTASTSTSDHNDHSSSSMKVDSLADSLPKSNNGIDETVVSSSGAVAAASSNNGTNDDRMYDSSPSPPPVKKKSTWKEPSQAAVSMSLRAERETTGGKRRLASDLYKIMMGDTSEQGFKMEPTSEDSMDLWTIKLFGFDKDSNLYKDMKLLGLENIELEMSFPDDYPFAPPFVRVVRPRFKRQTGFVMNGALCMELLTSDGWNPVNDIESVIVSIRSLLVVGDGRLEAATRLEESEQNASDIARLKLSVKNVKKSSSSSKAAAAGADAAAKDADGDSTMGGEDDAKVPAAAAAAAAAAEEEERPPSREKKLKNDQGDGVFAAPAAAAAAAGADTGEDDGAAADQNEYWMEDDSSSEETSTSTKKRLSEKISSVDIGSYSASEARSAYSHLSDYHKRKGWDSSGWWARKG